MNCPNCNVSLTMTERSGIEIDYCPNCRGVWLDRGELDKIIERSNPAGIPSSKPGHYKDQEYRYKKKKGLFDDLFDF